MEKINEFFKTNMFSSVLLLVLGIILTVKPNIVISLICYGTATVLLVVGINAIIKYIQNRNVNFNLFGGIIFITVAFFLFFRYETVVSFIPFILGIYIIINSALKIEYIFVLKNNNNQKYINVLVTVIISLICGLFLVFNPFTSTLTITRIIGLFIIIYSILDIYQTHLLKREVTNFFK